MPAHASPSARPASSRASHALSRYGGCRRRSRGQRCWEPRSASRSQAGARPPARGSPAETTPAGRLRRAGERAAHARARLHSRRRWTGAPPTPPRDARARWSGRRRTRRLPRGRRAIRTRARRAPRPRRRSPRRRSGRSRDCEALSRYRGRRHARSSQLGAPCLRAPRPAASSMPPTTRPARRASRRPPARRRNAEGSRLPRT